MPLPQRPPPYSLDRNVLEREVAVEVFRASGPGGQHVNKTESALRLTHLPSGVVVMSQDSPSQFRNRETAFKRLIERLKRLNHVPKKRVPHQAHGGREEATHRDQEAARSHEEDARQGFPR